MKRYEDWPKRLSQIIEERRNIPFRWGENDCCLFACDVVERLTGVDLAKEFRGKYNSRESAYIALKRYSGGGVLEVVRKISEEHGMESVLVPFAQRGDVAMAKVLSPGSHEVNNSLGIVCGANAAFVGERGLSIAPTLACLRIWRV